MLSWLENHMLPCAYKSLFGIDCPACGLQRSCIQLLKGNFKDSLAIYPPLPAVLIFLLLLSVYLINKRVLPKKLFTNYAWFTVAVVLINYFVKLLFLDHSND